MSLTEREEARPDAGRPEDGGRGPTHVRVLVVGAGFAGLAMAVRLKQAGIEDFVVLERGDDVGGTWRDNTYPGAACDVPSHLYSFSFAPNPRWSRSFSPQREILDYLRDVARRYRIGPHLRLRTGAAAMRWATRPTRVPAARSRRRATTSAGSKPAYPIRFFKSSSWA